MSQSYLRRAVLRCAALFLLFACALSAFFASASSAATGHTGQALALRTVLHPEQSLLAMPGAAGGRYAPSRSNWTGQKPSRITRQSAHDVTGGTTNPNNVNDQAVQTFDTLAPPTNNFQSTIGGFGADNHNPVWSRDESYIVFVSNVTGHDHLFYVSSSGGAPVQITTGNGDEEFPALNSANSAIAFTSTANSPGVANLYTLNFSPGQAAVDVSTLTSLTIRGDLATGFAAVGRPTWSPGGDRIAFAAYSIGAFDPNKNHFHIYFLYTDSLGYRPQQGQSSDNPPAKLTDGPADDTDPAWSFDGRLIAFASTAGALLNNPNSTIDPTTTPQNVPTQTQNPTAGARSLFVISGGNPQTDPFGTAVQTGTDGGGNPILGRITTAGTDDFGPAWSYQTTNQYLNPNGDLEYLAFARSSGVNNPHDIYYLHTEQFDANGGANISAEGALLNYADLGGTFTAVNNAVLLNTDDNPNQTSAAGNAYDDIYPTVAPFQSLFRMAYSSNRTVTYTNPNTGNPVETAISLPAPTSTGAVNTTYRGILQSEVLNLNAPTLLRFSGSEVIHVNAGAVPVLPSAANPTGSATKNIQPTAAVTFTVRLSSREAGIDDTGLNGSPKVFLQIKDPDSSTQDSQQIEHKVFTTDGFGLQNRSLLGQQFVDSGTATKILYNLGFGNETNIIGTSSFIVRGSIGGRDGNDYITVGHYAQTTDANGNLVGDPLVSKPPAAADTPNPYDPRNGTPNIDPNFMPLGQEYECQYVNPQFALNNTGDTAAGDYGTPYYLAGFDDAGAFVGFRPDATSAAAGTAAGKSRPPRPTDPSVDANNNPLPAEWLQMNRLPDNQQDYKNGGVLYSITWVTPRSSSDFFLDVIAYDKALFPSIPPPAATTSATPKLQNFIYVNQNGIASANFRIYDNTGGFTTAPFDGSHDILVISDNALGQKFGFSTFGSQSSQQNLKPTLYGAESYFTDVDASLVPNCLYRVVSLTAGISVNVQGFTAFQPENGLGINSYPSGNGSNIPSQRYSLWRTLSRGPVTETVLRGYSPTSETQPAVADPVSGLTAVAADGVAAPKVPVATKCVVWVAPYTGDLLTDAGSLADTATQQELRYFVQGGTSTQTSLPGGGRLFISGSDIAETLTLQGNANNAAGSFLNDVLNAKYVSSQGGTHTPGVSTGRILGDAYFNSIGQSFPTIPNGAYQAPASSPSFLFANDQFNNRDASLRTDGSLNQFGPNRLYGALGSIDTISPQNGAHSDLNFGGAGGGMTYLENALNGSRTVYMSFGLEALGLEYYEATINNEKFFAPHNLRPNVLHNVVDYLRTGAFTGFIRQGTAGGAGVAGATVYLLPGGNIPGSQRAIYSGITDSSGQYFIHGVEPGNYQVIAYKQGYTRATSATTNTSYSVNGDETANANLNISLLPPGGISGKVVDTAGIPIAGAAVKYTSPDGSQTFTAISATNGTYSISNVLAGTYAGIASKPPVYADSPPNSVTVTGGQVVSAPDLVLSLKGANISGRVYNVVTGNDIPGATVTLTDSAGNTIATTITGAQTDQTPNYSFTNAQIAVTGGTYKLTATATGFTGFTILVNLSPGSTVAGEDIPLTPIPPAQNGALGGLVTDGYTGSPLAGVTITVLSGTTVVATVTTGSVSSPAAPNGDSNPVNYIVSNLPPGQYTVRASRPGFSQPTDVTATVNSVAFTRVDFTGSANFQPLHVFPAGLNFFSVPYDFSGQTFDGVFNAFVPNNRSHIAVYQPQLLQYVLDPTPPADGFHLGQGYWVRLAQPAEVIVDATSLTPGTPTISVALHRGWNMIGVPNKGAVPVANLSFANAAGGAPITFANATSPGYLLVSGTLYDYNGNDAAQGSTLSPYSPITTGSSLLPWQAYWIYAYVDTTILIPAG